MSVTVSADAGAFNVAEDMMTPMASLAFDLRLVLRGLWRRPGYLLCAIVPLALAITVNTTLHVVTRDVVGRPRALMSTEDLYVLWETSAKRDGLMSEISYPDFLEWRDGATSFENLAAMGSINWAHGWAEGDDVVRSVPYRAVSSSFFDVLGVDAALGRTFVAEDDEPDADRVVVLSHGFWQSRLGGALDVVGDTIGLGPKGDEPYTVIGVMPPELRFPREAEVWTSLGRDLAGFDALDEQVFVLFALGRLRVGVSPERAHSELSTIVRRLSRDEHDRIHWREWGAALTPVETFELGNLPVGLRVLRGAAGLLLLISSLTVSGLVLARSIGDKHELAIRSALGAGFDVVLRKTLLESMVLVVSSMAVGVGLSCLATPIVFSLLPIASPLNDGVGLAIEDGLLGAGVGGLAVLLIAVPAMVSVRPTPLFRDIASALSSRSALQGWQRPLIVTASAIALVLATAAGLLVRSYLALGRADLGFRPANVLSVRFSLPNERSDSAHRLVIRDVIESVESSDDVIRAAAVTNRPLQHGAVGDDWRFIYEGQSESDRDTNPTVNSVEISPGYFQVMGIPLLEGRSFDEGDRASTTRVVVVGESLARYAWPGEAAVGKRIWLGRRDDTDERIWWTVVGVVADVRYRGLTSPHLDLYLSFEQTTPRARGIVALTRAAPYTVAPAIRARVRAAGARVDIEQVTSLEDAVAAAMAPWRFNMMLSSAFAAFALALAGLGLFGVVAYTAGQRTREMGIRSAVGASPSQIWRLLTKESLSLVLVGIAVGICVSLASASLLSSLLYGVAARDTVSLVAAVVVLVSTGFFACHLPAHRAARVSPIVALHHD